MGAKRTTATRADPTEREAIVPGLPDSHRGVFCNRTLNLRSIAAIGYDMDYTLVHYHVAEWERRAYEHIRQKLVDQGWAIADLEFDPSAVVRGLIIDKQLGNFVKANRFGYVKQARHGTGPIDFAVQRKLYSRTMIDLSEERWVFLNTLFSLSAACLYSQLVDLLDEGALPIVLSYEDLYEILQTSLDATHMEGLLKQEIMADPDRFVDLDPEMPLTLLDQHNAGKKLLLITNSEWEYSRAMMEYAFNRFLPDGMAWEDVFDIIIVSARKPEFFSAQNPFFRVVDEAGLLKPVIGGPGPGGVFLGGNATAVERHLGVSGDQILYVGDHMFSDVKVTKSLLRWRTALVVRELEDDVAANVAFGARQERLTDLMKKKERLEVEQSQMRLMLQRERRRYGPKPTASVKQIESHAARLRDELVALDSEIAPLAGAAGTVSTGLWGPLMRAGNDKSHMARQVERHADIYTSRVSNLMHYTPFAYFRSPRGTLPHDM